MGVFDLYRPNLHEISLKYGTDKSWSKYTYIYDSYFNMYVYKPMRILEIGIAGGGSLRMWEEYFPNAKIYAVDINPDCVIHASDRTHVFIGDATDIEFFKREVFPVSGTEFDLIIDDASHRNDHIIMTMNNLFPYVALGGHYVVEDFAATAVRNSEWYVPYRGYETFLDYVSYLQQEINFRGVTDEETRTGDERTCPPFVNYSIEPKKGCSLWSRYAYSISVYVNICFIEKQSKLPLESMVYEDTEQSKAFKLIDKVFLEARRGELSEDIYTAVCDMLLMHGNISVLNILKNIWEDRYSKKN